MAGINNLIIKKIDNCQADEKTKKMLKDLLVTKFMNQLKNRREFFDKYDDIISKNIGDISSL